MRVTVKFDLGSVQRHLAAVQKQVPFATAVALTRLAEVGKQAISEELERKLDKPKPFTTRTSVYTQRATKAKLYSVVGLKDKQAEYLDALLRGGNRKLKGSEQRFLGRPIVPGPDVRLDRYGNIPRLTLVRILKAAQAKQVMPDGRFVFVTDSGVFARKPRSRKIQTLLLFADRLPTYSKRMDLGAAVSKAAQRRAQAEFERALGEALRSAR